jgi:hypothetical protein
MKLPFGCDLGAAVNSLAELPPITSKPEQPGSRWYAAYTCPRHEKYVARQLNERSIDSFLPLYRSLRRWKDRRKQIELPLQWPAGDAAGTRHRHLAQMIGSADLCRTSSLSASGPAGTRNAWSHGGSGRHTSAEKGKISPGNFSRGDHASIAVEVDAADVQPA